MSEPGGPSRPDGASGSVGSGQVGVWDGGFGSGAGAGSSRWKTAVAVVAAVVVVIAGGAVAFALATGRLNGGGGGGSGHGSGGGGLGKQHQVVALKPPGCVRTAAGGQKLPAVPAVRVRGDTGGPFGVAVSSDGKAVFVVTDAAVRVYKASGGTLTYSGRSYPVGSSARKATIGTVTRDGRYLLVASDNGIRVLDAVAAENGGRAAVLGSLTVPGLTKYGRAVGVAVTPDDKFAFVSVQFRDQVGVFSLGKAIRENFAASGDYYLGSLDVGAQPVGLTISPDGSTLYATAFLGNSAVPGLLSVVDVVRATNPQQMATAVISKVKTGCDPARVAVSGDDKTVWVTARESNYLLGYSASALRDDPASALIAKVHVGKEPIGVAIVSSGKRIVVSDSDNNPTQPQPEPGGLVVIDTAAALAHKHALLGYIPAGLTPHEMTVSPNGRVLYVTNYDGSQIQIITVSKLP